ncbi:hypothetical protein BIW11_03666 [Tropilaelaps mercedesae]|uniref:Uncharacterized protein n=1 Tax=Tropilaelaps mercedesae TaxID=418985 RepID=A0A1V9XHZ0_9ACAR|nr:hypothetical protein BIW11_03666 [Tropilaelaps mercedesae]
MKPKIPGEAVLISSASGPGRRHLSTRGSLLRIVKGYLIREAS